jgi:hypothetical protein
MTCVSHKLLMNCIAAIADLYYKVKVLHLLNQVLYSEYVWQTGRTNSEPLPENSIWEITCMKCFMYQHVDNAQDFGTVCRIKLGPSSWVLCMSFTVRGTLELVWLACMMSLLVTSAWSNFCYVYNLIHQAYQGYKVLRRSRVLDSCQLAALWQCQQYSSYKVQHRQWITLGSEIYTVGTSDGDYKICSLPSRWVLKKNACKSSIHPPKTVLTCQKFPKLASWWFSVTETCSSMLYNKYIVVLTVLSNWY